jgi:chemotaxis response regulator CheB
MRSQFGTTHNYRFAQNLSIGRARAQEALPAAVVIGIEHASDEELDFVEWLARRSVPVLAVIPEDGQRRKLNNSGASVALSRPDLADELETQRHHARIAAWIDAVMRGANGAAFALESLRPSLKPRTDSHAARVQAPSATSSPSLHALSHRSSAEPAQAARATRNLRSLSQPTPALPHSTHAALHERQTHSQRAPAHPSSRAPGRGSVPPRERLSMPTPSRAPERAQLRSKAPGTHDQQTQSRHASEPPTSRIAICIGISTGGPEALEGLFRHLPAWMPPIVVVQHMPAGFTASLALRLDGVSEMVVKEAGDNEPLRTGYALIAPGGIHLRLRRQGSHVVTELFDAPPVDRHRPSVNVLFESAARVLGPNGVGVVMTGMGDDGTRGLLAMKAAGAHTIAQDALGCTVFGMPQRAILAGAVEQVVRLEEIAYRLIEHAERAHVGRA